MIKLRGARHCNSRHRRGRVRGIGVALLAHPLAPFADPSGIDRKERRFRALGAAGDSRAARASRRNPVLPNLRNLRIALRLRSGAVGNDFSRGGDVLDREPVLPARRHGAAGAAAPGGPGPPARAFSAPPPPPPLPPLPPPPPPP